MDVLMTGRGLTAGLAATGVMTLLELAARSRWGLARLLDWQVNQTTASRVLKRSVEAVVIPGVGLHFLHGLLLGGVFVLLVPFFPPGLPLWITGAGYGIALFAFTVVVHRPITGGAPWSGELGSVALAVSFVTHVVYGTILAVLVVWP